jgi:hypothetical protein
MQLDPLDVARFWSHVSVGRHDACWPWNGATDENGYGVFKTDGKQTAHRVAYTIASGAIPAGQVVRHSCDNPVCVNPKHLSTGTHADNVRDRVIRDRSARGERNGRARLIEQDVREIRDSGESKTQLAAKYDVSEATILAILSGRSWAHVTALPAKEPAKPKRARVRREEPDTTIPLPPQYEEEVCALQFTGGLEDPIAGLNERGEARVYPDWRWEKFLARKASSLGVR